MTTIESELLPEARKARELRQWQRSYELFSRAEAHSGLDAEDLERFAEVSWFAGRSDLALQAAERSFHAYVRAENPERAAYLAFDLAKQYGFRAKPSVSAAWLRRGEQILNNLPESYVHGHHQLVLSYMTLARGEVDAALAAAERAAAAGAKSGDADLRAEALTLQGRIRIGTGATAEGFANLEEAAAAAVSGELTPFNTGVTYCQIISACRDVTDYQRAREWTEETEKWCAVQSVSGFPGICRVHRAEVEAIQGSWERAERELEKATEELKAFEAVPPMADGLYALGELRRRRGDLSGAEEALRRSHELGHSPYPALALIRLSQGKVKAAAQAIASAITDETWDKWARSRLLPASIEIFIAAGDLDGARAAAHDLSAHVASYTSPALKAAEHEAWGRLHLAEGEPGEAARRLRLAIRSWQEVKAPYEIAIDRVVLASALQALNDHDGADLELEAAQGSFAQLGAQIDLARVDRLVAASAARRGEAAEVHKTFMFTDIEGSTQLAGSMRGGKWEQLLAWHDETLRSLFARHRGEVVSTTGDGFFVAFDSASEAVACAIDIQRALAEHNRGASFAPDVRIGLHTAEATRHGEDYSGLGVHIAARIAALAQGGEIVISEQTRSDAGKVTVSRELSAELKGLEGPIAVAYLDWS